MHRRRSRTKYPASCRSSIRQSTPSRWKSSGSRRASATPPACSRSSKPASCAPHRNGKRLVRLLRQRDGERTALLGRAFNSDVTTEQTRQGPAHTESESGTPDPARRSLLDLPERIEDPLQIFGGDSDASIGYRDDD